MTGQRLTSPHTLRIGTRSSALALAQTYWVRDALRDHWGPQLTVEIVEIRTRGDEILDRPLAAVGGKGLFVKQIEEALLERRVDLAVHSMKDLPAELPPGLSIVAAPEREDPKDVVVSGTEDVKLARLPRGTRVGTSSLRRAALALRLNGGLEIVPIRGNVQTRLNKLDAGEVDAVILAAAGLKRLGLEGRIGEVLEPERFCPACCQGILALEARDDDDVTRRLVAPLNHEATEVAARAERAFLSRLEGGCQIPLGSYAELRAEDVLTVNGVVADPSGRPCFIVTKAGRPDHAAALGEAVADTLLRLGAGRIIARLLSPAKVA
ncbi:MAG: hydroxymethylbilane synthase [Myxococcales bacterium FL481]|nr:MAG: hydroxymethylbilane synthase [Myxococcales bacterium FL481]